MKGTKRSEGKRTAAVPRMQAHIHAPGGIRGCSPGESAYCGGI